MDPEKWRPIREIIEAARKRRDPNAVAIATKVGVMAGDFLERNYPRGVAYVVDSRCPRIRVCVEVDIDLVTGDIEGVLGLQGAPFVERATQSATQPCPVFATTG